MIQINTTRYEVEQKSLNFEERLVLQCNAMQWFLFILPENSSKRKTVFIFQRLH